MLQMLKLSSDKSFLARLTSLFALTILVRFCDIETIKVTLLPAVVRLKHDKVPNIRINVVKTLLHVAKKLDRTALEQLIRPSLLELQKDVDRDVQFSAMCTLQGILYSHLYKEYFYIFV